MRGKGEEKGDEGEGEGDGLKTPWDKYLPEWGGQNGSGGEMGDGSLEGIVQFLNDEVSLFVTL